MALKDLLGDNLIKGGGTIDVSTLGQNDVIGIYFSAHWCPPCRGFTPRLSEWYNKLTAAGKKLEVVFASSDRDQAAFNSYFNEMPFAALPYANRDLKNSLSSRFGVSGIPTLVFVNKKGKLISQNGRAIVTGDTSNTGSSLPFRDAAAQPASSGNPAPLSEVAKIASGKLLRHGGAKETTYEEATSGKVHALYFSAHWCPPCRRFTPILSEAYSTLQRQGKDFEVVFVSADQDEASFEGYWGEMPWLAIPFDDQRIALLNKHFKTSGIPTLVLLDVDGSVISQDAVGTVASDSACKNFPWGGKAVVPKDDKPKRRFFCF